MTTEGPISQRTIDTLKRKQALESHFAEDFSSLTFPMLADLYYNEGDLVRAKKVCSIGLDHHPSHAPGLFLMAKILVRSGDLPSAEKWLDSVLDTDNTQLEAAE